MRKGDRKERRKERRDADGTLFSVSVRDLDPEREIGVLFGTKTIAEARKETDEGNGGHRRGATVKRTPNSLVLWKEGWPWFDGKGSGCEMKWDAERKRFAFVCGRDGDNVHMQFLTALQSNDPHAVGDLLGFYPWNAEVLAQMGVLYLQFGEQDHAEDMFARALFAFQNSFHPMFTLHGGCRMDYSEGLNATFFLALFRYANLLNTRGCSRTALEFVKFLATLDDSDPLGALLLVDHFALRAAAFDFVVELNHNRVNPDLALYPNVMFSTALAQFRVQQAAPDKACDFLLVKALFCYPQVLRLLAEKMSAETTMHSVLALPLFASGNPHLPALPEGLEHVENVFAARNATLWKVDTVLAWLTRCATEASRVCADVESHPEFRQLAENMSVFYTSGRLAQLANIYRHLVVSDFTDNVARLPREALEEMLAEDEMEAMRMNVRRRPVVHAPTNNLLSLFLSTLLPWLPVPNAPYEEPSSSSSSEDEHED